MMVPRGKRFPWNPETVTADTVITNPMHAYAPTLSAKDSLASSARVSLQVHPLELFLLFVGDLVKHFPVLTIVGGHPG